ncbi:MAG: hypothetical protein HPY84_04645 [Syntrophobacteraceae bacterium]|nr:hypothetical protein [Syntrophobacteraceae bacterium]
MRETHDDVIREKKLPRVGDTVRSRKDGSLWRVIEKREIWQHMPEDRLVPAIYLAYWKIRPDVLQGIGEMVGYAHTLHDNTFESNWEFVE